MIFPAKGFQLTTPPPPLHPCQENLVHSRAFLVIIEALTLQGFIRIKSKLNLT